MIQHGLKPPDLDSIEHLWDHPYRRQQEYKGASKGEGREGMGNILASVCQNLIESMPKNVKAIF